MEKQEANQNCLRIGSIHFCYDLNKLSMLLITEGQQNVRSTRDS